MKELLMIVTADANDADYITSINEVDQKTVDQVKGIYDKIKNFCETYPVSHNWPTSEYDDTSLEDMYDGVLTADEIEFMNEYVPYGEYGVHTLSKIEVYKISDKVTL